MNSKFMVLTTAPPPKKRGTSVNYLQIIDFSDGGRFLYFKNLIEEPATKYFSFLIDFLSGSSNLRTIFLCMLQ